VDHSASNPHPADRVHSDRATIRRSIEEPGHLQESVEIPQLQTYKRRELLALPAEKGPHSDTLKRECGRVEFAAAGAGTPKKIRSNKREYIWDVSTLDSLIVKWREQQFYEKYKDLDAGWSLVVINNKSIPANAFSSVPISNGDEISIVLGRGR
jgi:hypothetical protein